MSQRDGPNDTNAHRDATTQADNAAPNHRGAYQKDRGVLLDAHVWNQRIYASCTLGTEFSDLFCLFTNQTTQNSNPLADEIGRASCREREYTTEDVRWSKQK